MVSLVDKLNYIIMKKTFLFLFAFLFFTVSSFSQSVVELGRYSKEQSTSKFQGIEGVLFMIMSDGSYRYFVQTPDVQPVINQARQLGISASAGDLTGLGCLCRGGTPSVSVATLSKIRNLFFGFDQSSLTAESRGQLQLASKILKQNPSYSIKFKGFTDAKGSSEYNQALSERRVASAKRYLQEQGISSSRIRKEAYGKNNPIAKNTDSDAGRKFNRRVEIQIFDGSGSPLNMVEGIHVPDSLRN